MTEQPSDQDGVTSPDVQEPFLSDTVTVRSKHLCSSVAAATQTRSITAERTKTHFHHVQHKNGCMCCLDLGFWLGHFTVWAK